jgi:protein-S-isoprenylcysteine O-methyltransferase Ste14
MDDAALITALASASALGGLLAYAFFRPDFAFWPPPRRDGWRFRLSFGLFRAFCGATILFAVLDFDSMVWEHWSRIAVGLPLMLAFFWITLRGYLYLGLDNTYGARDGLVTGGLYAYSRNPQYVSSVLATVGLAITAGSPLTFLLAAVLLALYTLFALNEERWLRASYGQSFIEYMRSAPRFLDARSFLRAKRDLQRAL